MPKLLLTVAAIALLGAGCSKSQLAQSPIAPNQERKSAAIPDGRKTCAFVRDLKSYDATNSFIKYTAGSRGKIPDDFPSPLPGVKLCGAWETNIWKNPTVYYWFGSDISRLQIAEYYTNEFRARGYERADYDERYSLEDFKMLPDNGKISFDAKDRNDTTKVYIQIQLGGKTMDGIYTIKY